MLTKAGDLAGLHLVILSTLDHQDLGGRWKIGRLCCVQLGAKRHHSAEVAAPRELQGDSGSGVAADHDHVAPYVEAARAANVFDRGPHVVRRSVIKGDTRVAGLIEEGEELIDVRALAAGAAVTDHR